MSLGPKAPPPRDLYKETSDTLAAQIKLAPQQYEAEAKYGPLYALLGNKELENSLNGANGQRGLLDIYEKDLYPTMSRISSQADAAQRESDISAVEQYGSRATAALRASNPQQAALLDALTQQAQQGLSDAGGLDAGTRREVQQAARAAQAARGMGFGNADAFNEAMNVGSAADARRRQNQSFAAGVVNLNQATAGDPFMAILGRSSGSTPLAGGAMGQAQAMGANGPGMFDPQSAYAADLYNTNYNGQAAANNASSNFLGGILGGTMGMLGGLGGGYAVNRGMRGKGLF